VTGSPRELLETQLAHAFRTARWHVDGLTDDEYFWKPTPDAWSVHRRGDGDTKTQAGVGPYVIDGAWPPDERTPATTIAWRLVHLIMWTDVYRSFTFEDGAIGYFQVDVPGTAGDAVRELQRAQEQFSAGVAAAVHDSDLGELRPTHFGLQQPLGMLIWMIAFEHLHHSAEIGVLRDIRRGYARNDRVPEPTESGWPTTVTTNARRRR
jgi:hypothetical protein